MMPFGWAEIVIVDDGHEMICPKGIKYVVRSGEMVNNGKGKIYCIKADYEKIRNIAQRSQ